MREQPGAESRPAAFRHAFAGLAYLLRSQPNARIHAVITAIAVTLGLALGFTRIEWALLIGAIGLVWLAELFNTAVEALVDLVSPEHHRLAGASKDLAAAAVLVAALTSLLIGLLLFLPRLVLLFVTP